MKKPLSLFTLACLTPTICWSSIFHRLSTLLPNKCIQRPRGHLILVSFSEWPLVPLLYPSNRKNFVTLLLHYPETSWKPLTSLVCSFFLSVNISSAALCLVSTIQLSFCCCYISLLRKKYVAHIIKFCSVPASNSQKNCRCHSSVAIEWSFIFPFVHSWSTNHRRRWIHRDIIFKYMEQTAWHHGGCSTAIS